MASFVSRAINSLHACSGPQIEIIWSNPSSSRIQSIFTSAYKPTNALLFQISNPIQYCLFFFFEHQSSNCSLFLLENILLHCFDIVSLISLDQNGSQPAIRRWHKYDCSIPIRPLWFLWWENILFVCLLNPIKSRLLRDIRFGKFGCQTCPRSSACLVVMSFKGSKIEQVVNDAKNADSSFIFWNGKQLKSNEQRLNMHADQSIENNFVWQKYWEKLYW